MIKTVRADDESAKQVSNAVMDRLRQALLVAEMENKRLALENRTLKEEKATLTTTEEQTTCQALQALHDALVTIQSQAQSALANTVVGENILIIPAELSEITTAKGQEDMLENSTAPVLPLTDVADNLSAEHVSSTERET